MMMMKMMKMMTMTMMMSKTHANDRSMMTGQSGLINKHRIRNKSPCKESELASWV